MNETKMKVIGFEVTEEEWKIIKQKCVDTGHNIRTLFRPYVEIICKGKKSGTTESEKRS